MLDDNINKDNWYNNTKKYWENVESSIKGVLGGNDQVNDSDTKTNLEFLEGLIKLNKISINRVLDCGAGIGRVTEQVLQYYFNEVDIVEQDSKYIKYCKDRFINNDKIKNIYESSLQNFQFKRKYNVIWIQWCLENLNDEDLINFLLKCKENLEEGGFIFIKENIVEKGSQFRVEDSSKIRSDILFRDIFIKCRLKIIRHFHQPNWPKDFLKVSVFFVSPN